MTDALAVRENAVIDISAVPVIGGAGMITALREYKKLQEALDETMPECIIVMDGKAFRRKPYWRAVAVAFNLSVEPIAEVREVDGTFLDDRENFGYLVTYRATTQSGRSQVGDGACVAIEKAPKFRCPHPESDGSKRSLHFPAEKCPDFDPDYRWDHLPTQASVHNIRSHAHTRAYNRAVSNLVGFGEVSAEEMLRDEQEPAEPASRRSDTGAAEREPVSGPRPAGAVLVAGTDVRRNKPGEKEWTLYIIRFDGKVRVNGDSTTEATTFDKKVYEVALDVEKAAMFCIPELTSEMKGGRKRFSVVALNPMIQAATEPTLPIEADPEPVGGPEKVLTVAARKAGQKEFWVVNTDRRVYTVEAKGMADYCEGCRVAKVPIVVIFEVKPDAKGAMHNVMVSVSEVPPAA
jgi:hypothetical protein